MTEPGGAAQWRLRRREPDLPAVVLRKDLARSIRRGHPWLYRDALIAPEGLGDGDVVEVRTRDGRPIARGYWDAASPIAVRILESGGPGHRFADAHELVSERLVAALDRRLVRLDLMRTNAFRWVHGEADLLPGIHADYYAGAAVVRFDGEGARALYVDIEECLRAAAGGRIELTHVLDREDRSPGAVDERTVLEDGATFIVDLANAQKGGLFLDQRENRLRVAAFAKDRTVLNLFGYTGGFSLHAALAGASRTDTVDVAAPAIEAARRNFAANGLSIDNAGFYAQDGFEFLAQAEKRGDRWDIVISDPPSFAPRKDAVPSALRAYERLHRLAASVVKPGGLLCASSCSSHVGREAFLATVEAGVRQAGRRWRLESVHGASFDHPVIEAFPEGDYLKFAIGHVD
jgi:23S rRNA (cytosine1962-C5)-methyltransferase